MAPSTPPEIADMFPKEYREYIRNSHKKIEELKNMLTSLHWSKFFKKLEIRQEIREKEKDLMMIGIHCAFLDLEKAGIVKKN